LAKRVTLIKGDGVGPEIADVTVECVGAAGADIEWVEVEAGADVVEREGTPLPDKVLDSIRDTKAALKAPITTPVGSGFRSVNVAIRQALGLYACVRPSKYYAGVRSRYQDVDLVVIRENTEGLYAGVEFKQGEKETLDIIERMEAATGKRIPRDSGLSVKPISLGASDAVVRFAFNYARQNGRGKVTAVHKANILKFSDGLFLDVARKVAKEFPDVEFEDRIIDNMCMQLVQKPELYDVMVLPNLYGDIISDLCAGLVGGLGIAPGANIGDEIAVFEAVHGSAPKYKGLNKVNPTALILSSVMMLRHIGEREAADRLESATAAVIAEGKDVTYDLKPNRDDPTAVGTKEMGRAIIEKMKQVI